MASLAELVDGISVEFQSSLPFESALASLQRLTQWEKGKLEIVGSVKPDQVVVRCLNTFVRSNGTRFDGRLVARDDGCVLAGRFVASGTSRASAGLFLVVLVLIAFGGVLGSLQALLDHHHSLIEMLEQLGGIAASVGLLCLFGFGMIWNGSPTRRDMKALTLAIQRSLEVTQA